jgi:hypothetical protein
MSANSHSSYKLRATQVRRKNLDIFGLDENVYMVVSSEDFTVD